VVSLFPNTGSRRVVEVQFQYEADPQRIRQQRDSARYTVQAILNAVDLADREPLEQAVLLAEALRSWAALPTASRSPLPPNEEAFIYTAYGTLVLQRPTAMGLALAYKQLCRAAGLDCRIVTGQLERGAHVWNLVTGEGFGAHIDLFIDLHGEEPPALRLDFEMDEAGYSWDALRFPPTPGEWPEPDESVYSDSDLTITDMGG
jgi:hypothetical protein